MKWTEAPYRPGITDSRLPLRSLESPYNRSAHRILLSFLITEHSIWVLGFAEKVDENVRVHTEELDLLNKEKRWLPSLFILKEFELPFRVPAPTAIPCCMPRRRSCYV